jgi:hypothetical protein
VDSLNLSQPVSAVNGVLIAVALVVAYLTLRFVSSGVVRTVAQLHETVTYSQRSWSNFVLVLSAVAFTAGLTAIGFGIHLNCVIGNGYTLAGAPLVAGGIGTTITAFIIFLEWLS